MKIKRTENNLAVAEEIIEILRGAGRPDAVLSMLRDGSLCLGGRACGISDGETVLANGITPDSYGDGWDSPDATPEQMLETLEMCSE